MASCVILCTPIPAPIDGPCLHVRACMRSSVLFVCASVSACRRVLFVPCCAHRRSESRRATISDSSIPSLPSATASGTTATTNAAPAASEPVSPDGLNWVFEVQIDAYGTSLHLMDSRNKGNMQGTVTSSQPSVPSGGTRRHTYWRITQDYGIGTLGVR